MNKNENHIDPTAELRKKAVESARKKTGLTAEDLKKLSPVDIISVFHELQVHQIELVMQNEELRKAQFKLDSLRARYYNLYDLAPVGYCTISEKGLIVENNLTAATLLGISRSEMSQHPLSQFIFRDDQDIYFLHRKQLFETKEPQVCFLRMVKKTGMTFSARLESAMANDDEGIPVCLIIISDITAMKLLDDERELASYLTLLNTPGDYRECMSDLISILKNWSGCETVGIRLSSGYDFPFYETLGFSTEFIQSESSLCAYDQSGQVLLDDSGNPELKCFCGKVLCGRLDSSKPYFTSFGSFWTNNIRVLFESETETDPRSLTHCRCHDEKYESVALIPMRTDKKVWGLLQFNDHKPNRFTLEFITRMERLAVSLALALNRRQAQTVLKKSEDENTRLQASLQQSQKMEAVGRLAGGVAHDFNNMLGVILGHVEMALFHVEPDQPIHSDLTEIRMAAERSADLTQQLLAFARRQIIVPKVFDLNEIVEGMLKILRRLIGECIHLVWKPGSNLWLVKVDLTQINQILANLCVNSMDAITDVGQITIKTENISLDEEYCSIYKDCTAGDYVRLTVIDNGSGMDETTLSQIFEPFFTTKDIGKGTGLGLATVYGAVKQNGGIIRVSSKIGQGTSFEIFLPRNLDKIVQNKDVLSEEPSLGGNETILVVEDEPSILTITKTLLEREGYHVLTAENPDDAIRLARDGTHKIHLLITDVIMPEMNGQALVKTILAFNPDLKYLFMSGYTADVIARHGVLHPGAHFIEKPFTKKKLCFKVREALDTSAPAIV
ncbi:MAG: ATP-binding protein [Desulfobacteraceae bacterium]